MKMETSMETSEAMETGKETGKAKDYLLSQVVIDSWINCPEPVEFIDCDVDISNIQWIE